MRNINRIFDYLIPNTSTRLLKVVLCSALLLNSISSNAQQLDVLIETSKGDIRFELNARAAPTTVANFINLVNRGFYDGLIFHRYERNFMIQGGDPLGTGLGGPGYQFTGETILKHNQPGVVSMANSGPGTDGSQFFITHLATSHLDGLHSVFGKVVSGQNVVNQLRRRDLITKISIEGNYSALFERKATQLQEWNAILDREFPRQ